MRSLAILALAGLTELIGPSVVSAQAVATSAQVKAVYELYTSQGCSSCPAADAVLGQLAKREDVIALTLPVDIWDYLGWRDTLARPEFTERQKAYARVLGDGMVYTPQAVVNGLVHLNGINEERVERAIEKTAKLFSASRVSVKLSATDGKLLIDVAPAPKGVMAKEATVWLAAITSSVKVPIARGENQGRTIVYSNVVSRLMPIGTWDGKKMVVHLDRRSFMQGTADRCAVILQQGHGGPIVGAALLDGI
ncbi:MAG: DUF1223 domain-containing protein [Hyphomicrobiaceae bacterium]|nr:DUF1223 domain-containing protein [Hyphomicrobiaceae bacterium]